MTKGHSSLIMITRLTASQSPPLLLLITLSLVICSTEALIPSSRRTPILQDTNLSTTQSTSRRDFVTTTATTIAGVTTATSLRPTPTPAITTTTNAASSSPLPLPPMGLGAWAWGDSVFWGYNPKQDSDLRQVFDYALDKNLAFFDTAEIYGLGRSETLLGQFRAASSSELASRVQIASKFAALPWRTKARDVVDACRASIGRLGAPIDLYQIHFPNAWANEAYWDGLARCYEEGLVRGVGVSNYGVDATRKIHGVLKERGIPLTSNQIQLSLLYRYPLENDLKQTCDELNVKILAYSPLALGFLTGKYNKQNLPSGPRAKLGETLFESNDAFEALLSEMAIIAKKHDGVVSQVALNWCRAKGTVPIPGARNLKQVKQNLGALDWDLTQEEVARLDEVVGRVPQLLSPEKSPFPKEDIGTKLKMFDS